jgi:hypothetical protein
MTDIQHAPGKTELTTGTPYSTLTGPVVEAHLYNPTVESISLKYPYKDEIEVLELVPELAIYGKGLTDGSATFLYRIESAGKVLVEGKVDIKVENGWFESGITLATVAPTAEGISWEIQAANTPVIRGYAPLSWSRFHGKVRYVDGGRQSTILELMPVGWGTPGKILVPVTDDGVFDTLVPSWVYSAINCCGMGYTYNCLERWAWDYDLTHDRHELFTVGRMELYGMQAHSMFSPLSLIFIQFRPSTLSRVLRYDLDGDGLLGEQDRKALESALVESQSPTVIGPELNADDVRVWLDGKEEKIVRFDMIPEYDGGFWQVQYILQISPDPRPARGSWHEIKIEVRSKEQLHGKEVIDFGEGSVGYFRP